MQLGACEQIIGAHFGGVEPARPDAGMPNTAGWIPDRDVNHDGTADVFVYDSAWTVGADPRAGTIQTWYMARALHIGSEYLVDSQSTNLVTIFLPREIRATGDFDGDGHPDLLWHDSSSGGVGVWTLAGARRTSSVVVTDMAGSALSIVAPKRIDGAADFDGDGQIDLLEEDTVNGGLQISTLTGWPPVASGNLALHDAISGLELSITPPLSFGGLGDLDGNGQADILVHDASTGFVVVWLMNGPTRMSSEIIVEQANGGGDSAPPPWSIKSVGDFDGDRNTDLLFFNSSDSTMQIWFMRRIRRMGFAAVVEGASLQSERVTLPFAIATD